MSADVFLRCSCECVLLQARLMRTCRVETSLWCNKTIITIGHIYRPTKRMEQKASPIPESAGIAIFVINDTQPKRLHSCHTAVILFVLRDRPIKILYRSSKSASQKRLFRVCSVCSAASFPPYRKIPFGGRSTRPTGRNGGPDLN